MPIWIKRRAEADDAEVELTEDEFYSVSLFYALGTQWRRCAFTGALLGLDYNAVRPTMELLEIPMKPQILPDLQVMESAAINAFARARR